jgi:1-hydroxycarotenoid 3,4-desaturase
VVVIGAGLGGLAAAVDLARQGLDVTVVERAAAPGGKMRQVPVGAVAIDAGPTVFTMRWIFEELFAAAGASLAQRVDLVPAELLARHAWRDGGTLDLFADIERSAAAIGALAGAAEARGYRAFCRRSADIYRALERSFIAVQRPGLVALMRRVGLRGLGPMLHTTPFQSLWQALGQHFRDPRLRQLFGRYATYVGSSPFATPATLMLVAHVEQDGVWLVRGGIHRVAAALCELACEHGARFRFGEGARRIEVRGGRACGVALDSGETLAADAVVFNGDVQALANGLLGDAARGAGPSIAPGARSLSAVTWCAHVPTRGFELAHHNVFFARDYAREFARIFGARSIAEAPTVYICAQDRGAAAPALAPGAAERLLLLINAPADGDTRPLDAATTADLWQRVAALLGDCGLSVGPLDPSNAVVTRPQEFHALFPASGGALYGAATHGAFAPFRRVGAVSALPGLYLAGGSVHPGAGMPMATMSGRLAAARLIKDLRRD